jgi:hypothetical protein
MFLKKKITFTLLLTVSSVLTSFFETIDQLYPGPWKLLKKCIRIHVFIWVCFMDTVISHTWIELRKRLPRSCKHSPGYSCSRGFMDTVISHTWIELRKRLPRPCKHSPGYSCSRGSTNPVKHPYEYMDPDTLLQEFPRTWIQLINCL